MSFPWMELFSGLLTAALVGFIAFFWKMPVTLSRLSHAINRFEGSIEIIWKQVEMNEKRLDAVDQIFSNLAEKGVSTKQISEGHQHAPVFPFIRKRDRNDET